LPKGIFIKDYASNPRNFGERLRKARIDAGLQVKELAKMIGVTPDTVINWELRGSKPRGREIRERIKILLNVPVTFEQNLEEKKAVK
jgi:transcriptional regulator with XRE-family HTH domain